MRDDEGVLRFHELGAPAHEELTAVARWTLERLGRVLERHGRSLDELVGDDAAADLLAQEQPVLASCYGASAADRQLLGDAPGQQTRKLARAGAMRLVKIANKPDEIARVLADLGLGARPPPRPRPPPAGWRSAGRTRATSDRVAAVVDAARGRHW